MTTVACLTYRLQFGVTGRYSVIWYSRYNIMSMQYCNFGTRYCAPVTDTVSIRFERSRREKFVAIAIYVISSWDLSQSQTDSDCVDRVKLEYCIIVRVLNNRYCG
jgi:hypothetical protein